MIRKGIVLMVICSFTFSSIKALDITANVAELQCGNMSVTFTFVDCAFDGFVLLGNNPPSNIEYIIPPQTLPSFLDFEDGQFSFEIDVSLTNSPGTFDIEFVVVSSNMDSCADTGDVGIVSLDYNCIPDPPPVNNDCSGAIPLQISIGSCSVSNYNTSNTTPSGIDPGCDFPGWVDLWYSFTSNNDTMTLYMENGPGSAAVSTLYDGSIGCTNLGQALVCDTILLFGQPGVAIFTDLDVGANYFLQISFNPYENGNDQELCLHSTFEESLPCQSMVSLSGMASSTEGTESMDWISSDQQIISGAIVNYDATDSISLLPSFEVGLGASFHAFIDGCGGAMMDDQRLDHQDN